MSDTPGDDSKLENLLSELDEVTDDISDVKVYDIPVLVIFVILIFIVALQFFTRYALNDSLGWTEEIARYLLILLGFIGSITCIRKGKHIYLEFFYRYVPRATIKSIAIFVEGIVAAFFGYAGVLGLELAERTKAQRMVSIDLPKSVIYYIVVFSCFAMAVFALFRLVRYITMSSEDVAQEKHEGIEEI